MGNLVKREMDSASTSRAPSLPTEFGANRLLAAKRARKKAEDDHQLLQNRLHRLQVEEQRAASKIEETRKRAEEILALKARNVKARADKEASMRQSEEEVLNAQQRACEQRKLVQCAYRLRHLTLPAR